MSLNGTIQSIQTAVITESTESGTATTLVDRLSISGNTNILANGEFEEWTGFSTLNGAQLQVQDLDFVGNENMEVHMCKYIVLQSMREDQTLLCVLLFSF
jgi:hypothetical protein